MTQALTGLAEGFEVRGKGKVKWMVLSDDGRPLGWKRAARHALGSLRQLLSPQTFIECVFGLHGRATRTHDPKNKSMTTQPGTERAFLECQLASKRQ